MLSASFLFAILCFCGIFVFFAFLPPLNSCPLPEWERPAGRKASSSAAERLCLLAITAVYAFAVFWNLGDRSAPQTFAAMEDGQAVLELSGAGQIAEIVLYPGVGSGSYRMEYSADGEGWLPLETFTQDHVAVLKWASVPLAPDPSARYLRIVCDSGSPWLGEAVLRDASGSVLPVRCTVAELADEQSLVPDAFSYRNSSYFDEIYHVRTAWEHLNGIWPYEISHPPLGKELISLGILLFGMTPFGWRFSGTLAGVLMLPVMYLFLRRLFQSGRTALLGSALLAAGFMHYAQTRIATVDSFAVLFILLMFHFMLGWLQTGKKRELALSGICFGFGSACKWTCLYAGAGLAVLWLAFWISALVREGRPAFRKFAGNCLFCIIFFLLIPACIYALAYLPYGRANGISPFGRLYLQMVLENQRFMFQYHASIVAEHPYSSRWYQWVLNLRPILYYLEYLPEGKRVSIAAFVNPLICWGGLVSIPVLLYLLLFRKDRTAGFLLVGYLSGLFPWMFISRLTFEYHYFASALFLVPILAYMFHLLEQRGAKGKTVSLLFTAAAVLLFVCFFPVLNGLPVDNTLATKLLGWLPSWPI